ncbi:hypothetical protein L915_21655 [Phytophthora nicotianae]|uniref:Uncharacterized protein n=1 Tax=Phytophthora nicotianae TaxID=4792 RepID=W2FLW7_PHYNI|nr:hypothetical protein L915_21655 [Phytophthora nicotianae]
MTVEDYVARQHQINELIQLLPTPNDRLSEDELCEIVEPNMPASWQKNSKELKARTGTNRNGRKAPKDNNSSSRSNGQSDGKRGKKQNDKNHDSSECRAKNKDKEEVNYMDIDISETLYKIEEESPRMLKGTSQHDESAVRSGRRSTELLGTIPWHDGKARMVRALADFGASPSISSLIYYRTPSTESLRDQVEYEGGNFNTIGSASVHFEMPEFTTNRVIDYAFYVKAAGTESRGYDLIIGRDLVLALDDLRLRPSYYWLGRA